MTTAKSIQDTTSYSTGITQGTTETSSYGDTTTDGKTQKKVIKPAIMSSEFLNIPIADDKNGLSGVFMVPQIKAGTYFGNIPGMELFPRDMRDSVLIEPDRYFENFVQRPIQDEYLQPWTETELKQLGISVQSNLPKAKPEEQSTPKQALPIVRTVHTSTDEQPKRQIKTNLRWLPDTDTENGLTRI